VKVFSYVVVRDYGFAPNPFLGVCSLATCKPKIRGAAQIGDLVVGTGSKKRDRHEHLVYAMRVTETMSFNDYWADPRFQEKKPNLGGSKKQRYGDNIYFREPGAVGWHQADSHHSREDGSQNPANIAVDTSADRVLLSQDFVYWGGSGPRLADTFLSYGPNAISLLCPGRGHKINFPPDMVREFVAWIHSFEEKEYVGKPLDWSGRS
jgi:hypothetical protein